MSPVEEQAGKINYLIGKDPKEWHVNLPTYAKVKERNLYPGVDVVYYGTQQQLEYDFVVSPGANPRSSWPFLARIKSAWIKTAT